MAALQVLPLRLAPVLTAAAGPLAIGFEVMQPEGRLMDAFW